jgi:outer membrane receptor protein involved in Fe transport
MYVHRSEAALLALSTALATPCFAQSTTPADSPESPQLEAVVVTGSRLSMETGFEQPTPVKMFDAETLATTAPSNMGEALAQLPALAGSVQNSTSGVGSATSQANGQNLLDLRQLGPHRTLVLLDGQRMGVTNIVNSVDINIIPQNLVKRVDVVTGGASASYGSDAVAGVVNFVLDTRFEGLKTEVVGGITDRSDAENGKVSVAFGHAFGDRTRLIGGLEYFKMNGLKYGDDLDRDWFDRITGAWNNTNGAPANILVSNARSNVGTYGGTITAMQGCPAGATGAACRGLVNQQFVEGGGIAPFNFGTQAGSAFASGGDGALVNQPFTPDAERQSVFLHGEFDATDRLTVWLQGGYNNSETFLSAQVPTQIANTQFRIYEGNPYLPAAVSSVFAATPGEQSFSMSRYDMDFGYTTVEGNVKVARVATGLKGQLSEHWSWDTTVSYQDTHQDLDIRNTIQRNLYAAADAVRDPATGNIVCRSTLQGLDPGCVPVNLFGPNAASADAVDYIMGINTADIDLKQTVIDANIRGDLGDGFSLGAGPIGFAVGASYRQLKANRDVDALSAIYIDGTGVRGFPAGLQDRYGGYQFYNPSPLQGKVEATEGYVEFGVPLVKDVPFIQALDTTLAGRLTDYSQSGVEDMWKFGLNWTFNDSIRFRGTVSEDTRAPSVLELFNTATVTQGRNLVPYSTAPATVRSNGQNIAVGNPNLDPEHARTYTAGLVLTPSFSPGFQASIDYYKIDLEGSISAFGSQTVVDNCGLGDQTFCQYITVNGQPVTSTAGITANDFVTVIGPTLNAGTESTSGLDFEAAYQMDLAGGLLNLGLNATYLLTEDVPAPDCVGEADLVGAIGTCGLFPEVRGRVSAKYDIGRFGIYVQERYIDGGERNPNFVEGVDINDNSVPSVWYTDLTLTFDLESMFGSEGKVFLNVTNAFDQEPPPTLWRTRSWIESTSPSLYDVLGRRYSLGVRFKW